MNKTQQKTREADILYFIFNNKIALIRHIEKLFFNTYQTAKLYMRELEKKNYLKHKFLVLTGEKAYYLTYNATCYLKSLGLDAARYKIHDKEIYHDIIVIDILTWFIKNYEVKFKTDFNLRREMSAKNEKYRIPDFTFEGKNGTLGLVEYQAADKPRTVIIGYINDYKTYYPEYKRYFVLNENKIELYRDIFEKENFTNSYLCVFNIESGLKIKYKF